MTTPDQQPVPPVTEPPADLVEEAQAPAEPQPTAGGSAENPEKDVEDWVTGDEPMTGPQHSYLSTLAQEAGEDVPENLTKAQASQLIDRLQSQTGRGA